MDFPDYPDCVMIHSSQPVKIISQYLIKKIVFYNADGVHRMYRHRKYPAMQGHVRIAQKKKRTLSYFVDNFRYRLRMSRIPTIIQTIIRVMTRMNPGGAQPPYLPAPPAVA